MDFRGLLRSPLARLYLRPAFDRLAVPAIARLFFPLSRAWAAGLAADGDAEKLAAALPALARRPGAAERSLARLVPRAEAYAEASQCWEDALFGRAGADGGALADIERRREAAAQALMLGRLDFLRPHLSAPFPPIAWQLAGPEAVARRHGRRLADPARAFTPPDPPPALTLSRAVPGPGVETRWLRGPAETGGVPDTLWARVERPAGAAPCPALVFTHGICMENEFWREEDGPAQLLAAEGLAVVRPEGPFHGRRRRTGFFGGEPVFALGPLGLLDYFEAHVRELARLIAWARAQFGGPVAVGGVSLGALAAQLAVSAAAHWPAAMRPDAAFLVTGGASLMEVALSGSLPRAVGALEALAAGGWTPGGLVPWMPLMEPGREPGIPAEKIVVLLGRRDTVTPYAEGVHLARRWQVPDDNLFVLDLGHFTASLSLYRDLAPFHRLRAVMGTA